MISAFFCFQQLIRSLYQGVQMTKCDKNRAIFEYRLKKDK